MASSKSSTSNLAVSSNAVAFDEGGGSSGDDNVPVKPGTGGEVSVYFLLKTPAAMGWEIDTMGTATTITIPKTADWQVSIDQVTKRAYIEIENKTLSGIEVRNMQDQNGNPVPTVQVPKPGEQFDIDLKFKVPVS